MTGSVMASDLDALKAQIMQGADQDAANRRQEGRDAIARLEASEASNQTRQNSASVVNAINGASAFSTTANPYQPIPSR